MLNITTKTPLYIRDTLTKKEWQEKQEKENLINPDFFSPGDEFKIPGSTLRGLIRNLVEIVSFGKMTQVNNTVLYFRSFADVCVELRKAYQHTLTERVSRKKRNQRGRSYNEYWVTPIMRAGYLVYEGGQYRIYRAERLDNEAEFYRVEEDDLQKAGIYTEKVSINGRDPNPDFEYSVQKVLFQKESPNWHDLRGRTVKLWYGKVTAIKTYEEPVPSDWHEGYLVCSGFGPNKHMQWVITRKTNDYFVVSIEDYQNDVNRDKEYDLLKKLESEGLVPCFYTPDEIFFGHTGFFRLGYKHSIKEFIPENMRKTGKPDIAESIFGFVDEETEEILAGKVYFEDAKLVSSVDEKLIQKKIPKTLSSPKPTTFQHYLVQDSEGQVKTDNRGNPRVVSGLKNYNMSPEETILRGHKLYWHRKPKNWNKSPNEFNENIDTKIKPIPEGSQFIGRIRFENLTDIELGALLFVLDLPEECCHKLGMGKPLGLGSVKITPTLYLSNRKSRYLSLKAEWVDEIKPEDKEKIKDLKEAFEKYILSHLSPNEKPSKHSLWETYRLKQLRKLLDWTNTQFPEWNDNTRYMEITHPVHGNEFRSRPVLPIPEEVVKNTS